MSYTKTNWQTGDVIDADKLNKMEQGIEDANAMLDGDTVTSATDTDTAFINQNSVLKKITLSNLVTYIKNKIGSLKNPYALTFTGAVTETYDGSAAKTINIPSGSGGSSVTVDDALSETSTNPVQNKVINEELGSKVSKPTTNPNGASGQILQTNGDGTTSWADKPSGGNSEVTELLNKIIEITESVNSIVENLANTKCYNKYYIFLIISANTLTDVTSTGNINIEINNAKIGYYLFNQNLSNTQYYYIKLNMAVGEITLGNTQNVDISFNKATLGVQAPQIGTQLENVGTFKIAFPYEYAGKVTIKIYGE